MLIQLIYCSAALKRFDSEELAHLLEVARHNNSQSDITGMLLYAEMSFFQVLEGDENQIETLLEKIRQDERHENITIIIREPIPERSFGEWTMGYVGITPSEVESLIGVNDFFTKGQSFSSIGEGRAKKLLEAFKSGHWRTRISDYETPGEINPASDRAGTASVEFSPAVADSPPASELYSIAFQPIIHAKNGTIFSYEALLRGKKNESAQEVLQDINASQLNRFDECSRLYAIHLAAHLGISTHLNLNIVPSTAVSCPETIPNVLEAAARFQILPKQIVLEILESEIFDDFDRFTASIRQHRSSGLLFAIDDFGAGYAGLNLLAEFQPHLIKLDMQLIRNVYRKGPRQAIIRGILRTCFDLGIDVIAEGVETEAEYRWLRDEGIDLFQGFLFAKPTFETLSTSFHVPE